MDSDRARARVRRNRRRVSRPTKTCSRNRRSSVRDTAQIVIPSGPRLGNIVVEAENVAKAFGDRLLFENLEFNLPPGGIVGVIGPNGAGKTTLFRMLTGQETAR